MRCTTSLCRVPRRVLLHSIRQRGSLQSFPPARKASLFASPVISPSPSKGSALATIKSDLDELGPRIPLSASDINILSTPVEFYTTLKAKILSARKRIFLSTLYIGKTEHELISTIRHALLNNGPDLRVSILTDALRGTRESPETCCASLLAELVEEFPNQVEVRMYHTPNLTGLRKRYVPNRINEGWGLQHIKLYAFDDGIILSGANLSSDYFTNRQDRYHLFSSKAVTDYFAAIHNAVCSVSFRVLSSKSPAKFELVWPEDNKAPSPLKLPKSYIYQTLQLLEPLTRPASELENQSSILPADAPTTVLYPLLTIPPRLNMELPSLDILLTSPFLRFYTFTAGYFNPHVSISDRLLYAAPPTLLSVVGPEVAPRSKILTAHPHANGFFGSSGISGMLPAAYSHLALRFMREVRRHKSDLQLREWKRGKVGEPGGWTFHAKGLWLWYGESPRENVQDAVQRQLRGGTEKAEAFAKDPLEVFKTDRESLHEEQVKQEELGPQITLIGSSNHTERSHTLDLEAGAVLITSDPTLRKKLKEEEAALVAQSEEVTIQELRSEGRRADWRTRLAMWVVERVGGAL